jgi:hypothetical protein
VWSCLVARHGMPKRGRVVPVPAIRHGGTRQHDTMGRRAS